MSEILMTAYNPKKEPLFLYFLIFILFLTSMNLWIGWNGRSRYIYDVIGILMVAYMPMNHVQLDKSRRNLFSILALIIGYTVVREVGLGTIFAYYIPFCLLLLLREENRVSCIHYITKWFALLMIPSITTYLLHQAIGLPSLGTLVVNDDNWQPDLYIYRENFIFYNYTDFYGIRFNGPFLEPGHLGMMSAFLLFSDGFNFRKIETWLILAAIILSLSLSGYVLVIIGFFLKRYAQGQVSLKFIIPFFLLLFLLFLLASFYNGGENMLNEMIFARLEPDEDKGFSGNNRVFGEIDLYFAAMFSDRQLLLYGYDENTIEYLAMTGSRGVGFTMWMVKYGLIGIVAASLFYLTYFLFSDNKKFAFLSLVFVVLVFWQRSYPFWFSWIICFAYGISVHQSQEIIIDKCK